MISCAMRESDFEIASASSRSLAVASSGTCVVTSLLSGLAGPGLKGSYESRRPA